MNDLEETDPAWELLKKARTTEVSPVFAQNLLREVRNLDSSRDESRGALAWIPFGWGAALVGAAALVIAGVFLFNPAESPATAGGDDPVEPLAATAPYEDEITIEEFTAELDELAYMNSLLEVPDTSLLADEELAALLF